MTMDPMLMTTPAARRKIIEAIRARGIILPDDEEGALEEALAHIPGGLDGATDWIEDIEWAEARVWWYTTRVASTEVVAVSAEDAATWAKDDKNQEWWIVHNEEADNGDMGTNVEANIGDEFAFRLHPQIQKMQQGDITAKALARLLLAVITSTEGIGTDRNPWSLPVVQEAAQAVLKAHDPDHKLGWPCDPLLLDLQRLKKWAGPTAIPLLAGSPI